MCNNRLEAFFFPPPPPLLFFFIYLLSRLSTCNGRRCDTIRLDFIRAKKNISRSLRSVFAICFSEKLFSPAKFTWNVVTDRETCSKEAVWDRNFLLEKKVLYISRPRACWSIIESRQDNKIGWTRWNMLKLIKKDVIRYQIYAPLDVGCFEREESWSTRDAGLNTWLKMYKWRFFFFFFLKSFESYMVI